MSRQLVSQREINKHIDLNFCGYLTAGTSRHILRQSLKLIGE